MFELTAINAYKLVFAFELLVIYFIFTFRMRRRSFFAARFSVGVLLYFTLVFFFPVYDNSAVYTSVMFLCLFVYSVVLFWFCYDAPVINILFCGLAAYTTRHMAFQLYSIIYSSASVLFSAIISTRNENGLFNIYSDEVLGAGSFDAGTVFWAIIYLVVYIVVYGAVFAACGKKLWQTSEFKIKSVSLFALAAFVLLADIFLHAVLVYITDDYNPLYTILMYVYNIMCCLFTMYLQFNLIDMGKMQQDLVVLDHLLVQEREQYERTKENIELINMKCHDLKYQIRHGFGEVDSAYIKEITNLISIYDSTVKTGNEDLDVILTEKSLKCQRDRITFTCMADGAKLKFMDKRDIYGLFGNLVDNAMEAVLKLSDESKKIIDLSVHEKMNMLAITVNNFYEGEISFGADGLPQTTKSDSQFHGLGMKSVRMIVDKYDGDMALSGENGVFNVKILLAIPNLSE